MLVRAFAPQRQPNGSRLAVPPLAVETHQPMGSSSSSSADGEDDDNDPDDVIARRIIVKGDVQGGYYRSCVLNEVKINAVMI